MQRERSSKHQTKEIGKKNYDLNKMMKIKKK